MVQVRPRRPVTESDICRPLVRLAPDPVTTASSNPSAVRFASIKTNVVKAVGGTQTHPSTTNTY